MTVATLRLTTNGTNGTVELDGADISTAVRGFSVDMTVGNIPRVTLDLVVLDLTTHADTVRDVHIPEATKDTLVRLGWTPPGGDDG